ncbi:hypothetical protein JCM19238_1723 [Vibrio ponticus]|nr:hypothetical protein JCM19238_1723 [Vibrio ponticus]
MANNASLYTKYAKWRVKPVVCTAAYWHPAMSKTRFLVHQPIYLG